ncbi:ImmA/IrrE family metallo-endopeptidase [Pediococcus acidilactici]|uniref:ImmA/IrrE family metallo-endopeptidase n=1 Tax=Pediococcus acidilactici TaxID=1254 RepID=UPI00132F9097|nr:ImmA/IrrE family metallo-endopeptidase [Pediococcus acidilactici]KAF0367873.1 ImmA/IrrE family metallo-endopeptidase [Pediococcus acidilactici]
MSIVKNFIKTVQERYKTADPFKIAEILNIDVRYCYLGRMPLGKTNYDDKGVIIILNDSLRDSPQKYFTLAHELGHYFMHEGLAGYYTGIRFGYDEFENQANEFASGLLALFYVEEYDRLPNTIRELEVTYGLPTNS